MLIIWHIISLCIIEEYQLLICYSEVRSKRSKVRGGQIPFPYQVHCGDEQKWSGLTFDWLLLVCAVVLTKMSHTLHQQQEEEYLQSKAHIFMSHWAQWWPKEVSKSQRCMGDGRWKLSSWTIVSSIFVNCVLLYLTWYMSHWTSVSDLQHYKLSQLK